MWNDEIRSTLTRNRSVALLKVGFKEDSDVCIYIKVNNFFIKGFDMYQDDLNLCSFQSYLETKQSSHPLNFFLFFFTTILAWQSTVLPNFQLHVPLLVFRSFCSLCFWKVYLELFIILTAFLELNLFVLKQIYCMFNLTNSNMLLSRTFLCMCPTSKSNENINSHSVFADLKHWKISRNF